MIDIGLAWGLLALAVVVTFGAAAVQSTFGFGFNIISIPILLLVSPELAPVPQVIISLVITSAAAWRERHAIEVRPITWILVGRVPGALIGLGLLLVITASRRGVDLAVGIMVLAAVAVFASDRGIERQSVTEFAAGVTSGVMATVSTIGGPPLALLYHNDAGARVRANLGVIFFIGGLLTVAARLAADAIDGADVAIGLVLTPAALVGFAASGPLRKFAEGAALKLAIFMLSALAGGTLVVRAVLS